MTNKVTRYALLGKTVMTGNGNVLGTLEEIVIDTESGEMKYILVRGDNPVGQKIDSKGRAVYSFSRMIVGDKNITVS